MTERRCSVDGCDNKSRARGFCDRHYRLFMRNGVPELIRREMGSGSINKDGYLVVEVCGKSIHKHHLIAEESTGVKIVSPVVVHHVDGDKLNNEPWNLVICPDSTYHNLLHRRQRALDATGDPNKRKCYYCKKYDDIENLRISSSNVHHVECVSIYDKNRYSINKNTKHTTKE